MDENEKRIIQLEEKYKNLDEKVEEKYSLIQVRMDKVEKKQEDYTTVLSALDKSVAKFGVIVDNLSISLNTAISNLTKTVDEKINRLSDEIDKINKKDEKVEDREKKTIDSYKGYIISTIIGIVLGFIAFKLGLSK